ncbi:MAG: DNA polymerase ligase N-terminal domain-containing protein [Actinomycetota bacterium]|nr:DNA ligase [Actinomycetota bacterium]
MGEDRLRRYRDKRDFARTAEPPGASRQRAGRRFVIQKHDASSLHYDFRLEVGGVLRSWAVPKGLSTDPRDKRLAMPTEDHPMDYIDFEGVIPKGQYGGGPVIVWDNGTFENTTTRKGTAIDLAQALDAGHATVWLEGRKLTGGYAITRVATGKDERWLVVKMKDEAADARRNPVGTQPESVLSGRTVEDLVEEDG